MDRFDALIIPQGWRGYQDEAAQYAEILREFGPGFGLDMDDPDRRLYCRKELMGTGRVFVTARKHQFLSFDKQHPKYRGRKRYRWTVGPEGVEFGILTDEARAEIEAEEAAASPPPTPAPTAAMRPEATPRKESPVP